MADSLYLSLWFRDSELEDLLPHGLRAMQQFLYSKGLPGVAGLSIHPVSWNEATILEQRYRPGIKPEAAVLVASDLLHEDYGYVFEANWDLWTPESGEGEWHKRPTPVKFIARAPDFEEGEAEAQGEIQVDFGLDTPFLHEELRREFVPMCSCWWTTSIAWRARSEPRPDFCGRNLTRTLRRSSSAGYKGFSKRRWSSP
jgi:hypothetical protein